MGYIDLDIVPIDVDEGTMEENFHAIVNNFTLLKEAIEKIDGRTSPTGLLRDYDELSNKPLINLYGYVDTNPITVSSLDIGLYVIHGYYKLSLTEPILHSEFLSLSITKGDRDGVKIVRYLVNINDGTFLRKIIYERGILCSSEDINLEYKLQWGEIPEANNN